MFYTLKNAEDSKNNKSKRNTGTDQRKANQTILAPQMPRNAKIRKEKEKLKKEKKKFSKLSTPDIRESIILFNRKNGAADKNQQQYMQKSAEFRVLNSKAALSKRPTENTPRMQSAKTIKSVEKRKTKSKVDQYLSHFKIDSA